jgi:hypothetical protein
MDDPDVAESSDEVTPCLRSRETKCSFRSTGEEGGVSMGEWAAGYGRYRQIIA